jgi:hypothetical protein
VAGPSFGLHISRNLAPARINTAVTPAIAADMAKRKRSPIPRPSAGPPVTPNFPTELIRWTPWPADFGLQAPVVNTLATRLDYF